MSKVMFITPPYFCWGVQVIGKWPPLTLVYLAGVTLESGNSAVIFDAMNKNQTFADIRKEIERQQPDFVMTLDYLPVTGAISTATVPGAIEVLKIAKDVDPSIVTLLGGPHPTFMFQEILQTENNPVDFILRGEPEQTLKELLLALPNGAERDVKGIVYNDGATVVANERQVHIVDLDALKPAWHLLDWDDYIYQVEPTGRMASILTSRGCDMGCAFCSQRLFWRDDWRCRKPEKVIEEMVHLIESYGVEYFTLIDPYPTKHRERWEMYLDLLIERKLDVKILIETRVEDIIRDADLLDKYREAGIIHVYLGAESGDNNVLESLNKGTDFATNKKAIDLLRDAGIMTEASFMIGLQSETWESIEATIASAIELNPDIAVFPVFTPFPFTPIFQEVKDRIRIFDYSKYNLVTPIIEPYGMSLAEVTQALGTCYMRFYSNKVQEVCELEDGAKRRYMLSAFQLMMKDYGDNFDFAGSDMPLGHPGMDPADMPGRVVSETLLLS